MKFLNPFSKLSDVPTDLATVTDIGVEIRDVDAGLKPGSSAELWRRIEALYATGIQPGIQLCVRQQGAVILDRAIGHSHGNEPGGSQHNATLMRRDSPVNLFSAAKAVNAMLVHKLAEQGHFSIDDRIAQHLPGFERHGKQDITLRQVLTHRAALSRMPEQFAGLAQLDKLHVPELMREAVLDMRPQGRIGGAPAYHAITGGFILAELIREVTGRDPRELLNELIKQPLGAGWLDFGLPREDVHRIAVNSETGLMPKLIAWQLSRVVGAPFREAITMSNDPRFLSGLIPSGNVISTAHDMARFYQCLLDHGRWNGNDVFAQDTVRRAIKPDRPRGSLDRVIGIPIRYSPGFMVGHRGIGLYGLNRYDTFGHLGLSMTFTWARPDTQTVVCLITNGKPVLGPHVPQMLAVMAGFNALAENTLV